MSARSFTNLGGLGLGGKSLPESAKIITGIATNSNKVRRGRIFIFIAKLMEKMQAYILGLVS
jgi:hypothetical protein